MTRFLTTDEGLINLDTVARISRGTTIFKKREYYLLEFPIATGLFISNDLPQHIKIYDDESKRIIDKYINQNRS